MKIVQLRTAQEHSDLNEFVKTLYRNDSNFEYSPLIDDRIEINLVPKLWSIIGSYKSPSVIFVKGIVDQKSLNTLNPIIEVRSTLIYKAMLLGLLTLPTVFILIVAVRLKSLFVFSFLAWVPLGCVILYLMYKSGELVFADLLREELSPEQTL